MSSWTSYPKVYNLGHPAIDGLFDGAVVVEEKVDGSQLSFGRFGQELRIRSKGRVFDIEAPDNMFTTAAEVVKELGPILIAGWTYRCEYLRRPKHNVLAYERIPNKNLILFDITTDAHRYAEPGVKRAEASRLGLEVVPMYQHKITTPEQLFKLLENDSVLGGQKVEGVVIKNYERFGRDGHVLMGKHVSERFREVHHKEWTKQNPTQKDILSQLVAEYRHESRWEKAVNYLRDCDQLQNAPEDIGPLLRRVHQDIEEEAKQEIQEKLWGKFRKDLLRSIVRGLPEWYKQRLVKQQFGGCDACV